MKIALVTGPSGCGKSFVTDKLATDFDCLSYDRLMRDSLNGTFPHYVGDEWDKRIWQDNRHRLDLRAAFKPAFTWAGKRPLIVEGFQLRETVWRKAVLDLAKVKSESIHPRLFIIQPTPELLMKLRSESGNGYHKENANLEHCVKEIAHHERMYAEEPWTGELSRHQSKEETVDAVRAFLV
jgi:hypothetical protein